MNKRVISLAAAAMMVMGTLVPVSASTDIPSGAESRNGHYYKVYEKTMTWKQAEAYCEKLGGHLATITTADEESFIQTLSYSGTHYWIGATDETTEGTWKWVTGEKWSYTNWYSSGQPDNYVHSCCAAGEDYLELWDGSRKWNDNCNHGGNETMKGFVCEWDAVLSVSETSLELNAGESAYVTCAFTQNGTQQSVTPTWKSSKASVAKVSSGGKVVAVNPGTCKITVRAKGITKTISVVVKPKKVTSVSVIARNKNSIQLKWKKQSGAGGYLIQAYDKDLGEYVTVKVVSNGSINTALIKKINGSSLKSGKTYKFKVRAFVKKGSTRYYGKYSSVISVKTK